MWFVLLGIALGVVAVGGMYLRHRVLAALEVLGAGRRTRRWVGWIVPWLLFGYPVLVFVYVVASIALGRESFSIAPSGVADWLLVYPFWIALLVMLQSVPLLALLDLAFVAGSRRVGRDRARRARAISCFAVIAVFAVYTPARIVIERDDLELHHYQVGNGAPEKALRIAFLADLQLDAHTDRARAAEVVERLNREQPDLVLSGGDWINSGADYIDAAAEAAGALRARLGVTSVRGDHEHFAYRDRDRSVDAVTRALAARGVEVIHNQVRWIDHNGARIAILYLSYNYIVRTPEPEIEGLLALADGADYSILVTHQLDDRLAALIEDRVDLALVAHTHGGQVNPFIGVAHVSLARVETPYVAGRYRRGATTIIVTSGVGFSIAPFRYASPATIEIIDVSP